MAPLLRRATFLLSAVLGSAGCGAGTERPAARATEGVAASPADGACYQLHWSAPEGPPPPGFLPSRLRLLSGPDSGQAVPSEERPHGSNVWIGVSTWRRLSADSLEVRLRSVGEAGVLIELRQGGDSLGGQGMVGEEFIDTVPPRQYRVRGIRRPCVSATGAG